MIRLAALAALLTYAGLYLAAAVVALPIAARIGYHAVIRKTGVGMVRGGTHRIITGRL